AALVSRGRYGVFGAFMASAADGLSQRARAAASAADVAHLDLRYPARRRRADLGVAVGASLPHGGDRLRDGRVVVTAAQQRAQIVALRREEARVEATVGGEPRARAVAAERLRHRRDDADLAAAVSIAPALRD